MISPPPNSMSMVKRRLANALERNKEATAAVEEVAEELAVVHSVLSTKLRNTTAEGDLSGAVARTKTLEKKLSDTAEKMDSVNRAVAEQHACMEHLLNAK